MAIERPKGTTGLGELDPNQLPLDLFEFNQSTKVISLKDGYKFSHSVLADDATHADDADHADAADTATNATNAGNADTLDNAHADVAPTAGEIPILDGAGLGAFGISGNAATATSATSAGNADTVDGAHASATPGAGDIPILDGAGAAAIDITGNAATATNADDAAVAAAVTLADEAADTTCFPVFAPAATGDQALKTDTGYTYDPTTGTLEALIVKSHGVETGAGVIDSGVSADGRSEWELYGNGTVKMGGWDFVTGAGAASAYKTVTLPYASCAEIIKAVTSGCGYKNTTDPASLTDTTGATAVAFGASRVLSLTQISVGICTGGTLTSGVRYLLSWHVEGRI